MDIYAARIDELIKKGKNPSFRSRSERWKNGTHVTRLVERAKTSFGPGSRDIKERRRGGREGPGIGGLSSLRVARLRRWMLCTLRVPTRVLALPVLWPWTESIDLGVPLREHNRSRGSQSTTKYVLTRFVFFPLSPFSLYSLFPLHPPSFPLCVTLPPFASPRFFSIIYEYTPGMYAPSV